MTSNQNTAGESSNSVSAVDFVGRPLKVGDKVAYATANVQGTTDLHSAWIINLRTVTSNTYGSARECAVADLSYESGSSTTTDDYQAASEIILVESA
ncbi:hypothetical protein [Arthrobacter sp. zg-Y1110]|uniref:hypothetical protein n=1 Tax=Arthrobacter sp. zg-Y1110 TaxID=2886932 RepID=UPI001D15293E|nr:hypothetical protein [Arthrobacter sp. zg-Y1110]MCC3292408.1 hypothetical protein [Arthrobacter sp. zg-Y1110]UWX87156.1 hypothetical protein N2K99_17765 [Arthrobacter sp. zg-Y1110]